ncbi:hypothetical protein ACH4S8_37835 [Streptomyces sp. NPDC021080]|uniref:hypothetical protein n=1 Tax=Streptomyces sp. NPDC021080 TaxID=3365110 RepID=UPI0037A9A6DD
MAKRKQALIPWQENVWFTQGQSNTAGLVWEIANHLEQMRRVGQIQQSGLSHGRDVEGGVWWAFDAAWHTFDGARVKARLILSLNHLQTALMGGDPDQIVRDRRTPLPMVWTLTSVADKPWDPQWTSPVAMFLPSRPGLDWAKDWASGKVSLDDYTTLGDIQFDLTASLLDELSHTTWYTTVITHDLRPDDAEPYPALCRLLPPSTNGQILEIRARGWQDMLYNELLARHRVSLPRGGMVILPTSPRKDLWSSADYSFSVPGGDFRELLARGAEHVKTYLAAPAHYEGRVDDVVQSLLSSWNFPEIELSPATREVIALRSKLAAADSQTEELRLKRAEAEAIAEQSQAEVLEMMRAYREHPLEVREAEAREQAEQAFEAEEATQSLAEDLAAEVAWLRRRLALAGGSYAEAAPERPKGPESWPELLAMAGELFEYVRIGDVRGALKKLEGHQNTLVWLRRAWETLECLEAYASARKEHGPDVLPHFNAYLDWPGATVLVPSTWYCAAEVSLERAGSDHRGRKTRIFRVEGLGEVFMGAHVRVGGVRPGAPRMHLYDDLSGPTELIHVGYIGPHLPNVNGR